MSRIIIMDSDERRERAVNIISKLPLKPVMMLVIETYSPKRSTQQNRRYWMLLEKIAKEIEGSYDTDELHDMFKEKFLGTRVIEVVGERYIVRPSTRKLTVARFKEYCDRVEDWAISNLGIFLE